MAMQQLLCNNYNALGSSLKYKSSFGKMQYFGKICNLTYLSTYLPTYIPTYLPIYLPTYDWLIQFSTTTKQSAKKKKLGVPL